MSEGLQRDYIVGDEIGRGRFGAVRRCASRATGELFAVKSIDKAALSGDAVERECIDREAKLTLLAGDGNPNVVHLHGAFEDDDSLHLVLDLCAGPDLFDRIAATAGAPFPEPDAASVMAPLISALAACHRRGVAHRDVKPDNILFDAHGRLRLADFGSAAWFGGDEGAMTGVVGTPYYVAPEVVGGGEYGEKVDVWSAGVVLYILLSGGAVPFYGESAAEVFEAVLRPGGLRFPSRLFSRVSPAAKDLLRRMLYRDVSRRLSAEQVLIHPWITSGGRSMKEDGEE